LKFPKDQKAKASFVPGTLYAVAVDDFIFYCQVAANQSLGFFRVRSYNILEIKEILRYPIMSRFGISRPSLGRALRDGYWIKLGKGNLKQELSESAPTVQWPVGELKVSVWLDGKIVKETSAFDPEIQSFEMVKAYDAIFHVPERLLVDYTEDSEEFESGGTVWRQRKLKEYLANKYSTAPITNSLMGGCIRSGNYKKLSERNIYFLARFISTINHKFHFDETGITLIRNADSFSYKWESLKHSKEYLDCQMFCLKEESGQHLVSIWVYARGYNYFREMAKEKLGILQSHKLFA
tara:strand:+ start:288 stop:1169 length:882 start_codon:yes stop_codon:yes gene_type:complete